MTLQRDRKIDNIPEDIENECWSQNNPTKWRGQEGKLVGLSGPEHVTASPQAGHLLLLFIRFRSSSIPHNSHEGNYFLSHLLWNVRVSISLKWPFLTIYSVLFRGWWLLIGSLQVLIGFPTTSSQFPFKIEMLLFWNHGNFFFSWFTYLEQHLDARVKVVIIARKLCHCNSLQQLGKCPWIPIKFQC